MNKSQPQPTDTAVRDRGPEHYRSTTIQPWDAMEQWMGTEQFVGFLRGNAIKYLARAGRKGNQNDAISDLKKAQHYIDKMLESVK